VKALLIGAGAMGKAWARNLTANSRCQLVGWVDVRPGAAESAVAELKLQDVAAGSDLEELALQTNPDFVVDVTSPEGHYQVTLKALSMGLPVIGEKPMAVNIEQAREMVAASKQAGKLYMVSQSRRYDPGLVALRSAAIDHLGPVGILNADFYIGAHFGGFRDEMESPLLLDMAIHTFDQARFLTGADPVSVIADEFNPSWSWYKGAAAASATFEMSNGLRFDYRGSWCAEGLQTSWDADWRVVGEFGSAQWIGNGEVLVDLVAAQEGFLRASERTIVPQPQIAQGIGGSLNDFLDALENGTEPQSVSWDNIKSLAMVFAAKEASRTGTRTKVEW
jgi:predicted dehydrogenase